MITVLLVKSDTAPWLLVSVATAGNVLGSCVNWGLGRYIEHFKKRSWFPVKERALTKAQDVYARYGRWSLLLSWVPFIGDPITVMAGVMRAPLPVFIGLVLLAKAGRYTLIALLVQQAAG